MGELVRLVSSSSNLCSVRSGRFLIMRSSDFCRHVMHFFGGGIHLRSFIRLAGCQEVRSTRFDISYWPQ